MTREQFNQLLTDPLQARPELTSGLEEITGRFPFYTIGQILLTIQYKRQQSIRFENQLRRVSVQVPDRSILRSLVLKDKILEEIPVEEKESAAIPFTMEAPQVVATPNFIETLAPDTASNAEQNSQQPSITDHSESSTKKDPRDIIEERLRELSRQEANIREQLNEQQKSLEPIVVPIRQEKQPEKSELQQQNHPETEVPAPPVNLTISSDVKNVEIPPSDAPDLSSPPKIPSSGKRSFSDWLQSNPLTAETTEQKHEPFGFELQTPEDTPGTSQQRDADRLIDKFIKEEPRINRAKSEFYSPGNMARKSAQEHEDLISETLARIYVQQGHIAKAIEAYKRLSLKLPEKSGYFAALIEELNRKINN